MQMSIIKHAQTFPRTAEFASHLLVRRVDACKIRKSCKHDSFNKMYEFESVVEWAQSEHLYLTRGGSKNYEMCPGHEVLILVISKNTIIRVSIWKPKN